MDTIEFIRQLIAVTRNQTEASMKDITVEQLNWTPPGTASPVSAILIHMMTSEDFFFQTIIQGKPRIWEEGCWWLARVLLSRRGRDRMPKKSSLPPRWQTRSKMKQPAAIRFSFVNPI